MSATSSLEDEVYEYRLLIATAAALVCCAVGLVAATLILTTGDRFEYRPALPAVVDARDGPAGSSAPTENIGTQGAAAPEKPPEKVQGGRAPHRDGEASAPASCTASQGWPYSPKDCRFAEKPDKRRRIVIRLKSPWCSGVLRHQPFHACRPRPK